MANQQDEGQKPSRNERRVAREAKRAVVPNVAIEKPVTGGDDTAAVENSYPRDPKVAEFFGFSRGTSVFSLDKDGAVISRKLPWPGEPVVTPVVSNQFKLPIMVEGLKSHPNVNLGILAISGATGAGKSTALEALAQMMPLNRLLAVEPFDLPGDVETLPTFSTADGALAAAVAGSYADPTQLYAIDSLRGPLFETTGPASEKGIIMPFFTQLTRVSNQLARAGLTVVVTINPMHDDPEYVRRFLTFLSASVPTLITIESAERIPASEGKKKALIVRGTISSRPNRVPRQFTLDTRSRRQTRDESSDLFTGIEFEPISSGSTVRYSDTIINAIKNAE